MTPDPASPTPTGPRPAARLVATLLTVTVVLLLATLSGDRADIPRYRHYVALGDSYTAAPYVPLTDVAYGCFRSSNNYPRLVAQTLRVDRLDDRSCSGARTSDLVGSQTTTRGMRVPPQFEALTPETDLVTVGIGANDERLYARLASRCRQTRGFCPLSDERADFEQTLDRLRPRLTERLQQIRELAPRARVLLISYPRLLPPSGDCRRLPRMRPQDRTTFRAVNTRLRDEMRAAAEETGVEFVDFFTASYGHDVCSRRPWIQGRTGSSRVGAALHPLPAGQAALARLVVATLRRQPPASPTSTPTPTTAATPSGTPAAFGDFGDSDSWSAQRH